MIASVMLALLVQAGMPDSVRVTGEPGAYTVFGGRELVIAHLVRASSRDTVDPGDTLGTIEPFPAQLSKRHQRAMDSARALYERREFAAAATLLAPAYADERDNAFLANEYARTLFWIDDRRGEAFEVYRRLIERLDRLHGTSNEQVAVDTWFSEAYWKIRSLYLDREDWEHAAFEITRFLATRGDVDDPRLEQVYTYLAEAYLHLGRKDLARWSAQRALRRNPRNTEALGYLYQLGAAAREWPTDHVFACRVVTDSIPCRGGYAFYKGPQAISCIVPRQEPPTPLSPCLRIGWIYVGQSRAEVEAVLGKPWRATPPRNDEIETFAYLLFHDTMRSRGSYFVVEYERLGREQVVQAVQVTGDSIPLPLDFSGLRLGDPAERARRQLGAPEKRGEFNDGAQQIRGESWDWSSAGISMEIVGGRVYSVRLWRPAAVPPAAIRRAFMRLR